ncbi:NlpC/P60 family protein [Actinacidiphila sp. bgisy145]|uniref:C40 family peptidase n=1 Tax=Actinacidiphila sp. bgisy145 TaxID=3413792 RepID=UPI003EBE796D
MASHRKPRTPLLASTGTRAAVGLTTAAIASVTLLSETASAAPAKPSQPSISQVKKQVDTLNQQAEVATQKYDQAKEQTATQRAKTNQLLAQVADKTEQMNESRRVLGQFAAEQYRTGGFGATTQLLFSDDPESFLSQNHLLDRLTATQEQALQKFKIQQEQASVQRAQATASLKKLTSSQTTLATQKKSVQTKLAAAQKLLNSLTAEQKKKLAALQQPKTTTSSSSSSSSSSSTTPTYTGTATGRAATAIQFALAQQGKPYVYGATGPGSYDCSGLTQAAYKAAGISLGRTTWDQAKQGTAVSEADLRPGDLVFFYSGLSHVGIYIGNGNIVHAPHTGATVEVAPLSWMPFATARRIV